MVKREEKDLFQAKTAILKFAHIKNEKASVIKHELLQPEMAQPEPDFFRVGSGWVIGLGPNLTPLFYMNTVMVRCITISLKSMQVSLLNIVVELKKCCNHPFLFESVDHGYGGDANFLGSSKLERIILSSGKLRLC
ncbi:protein CHROMATIN REMODELING 5 [Dorcoceras hygrometricum]|uniref:Protein CHROMATIN REMODELING 5 n=2 Tax=Dorcoceras hygrometricum TaxID=472368 RepID=A0A2Z7C5K1_9LAMI|nr:protein CHROMATIN REMODELING 5 [Dorcoceras hygrometricum]